MPRAYLLALLAMSAAAGEAAPVFERDVRPLLEARCWSCHGEKARKGGLRLDSAAAILRGGDSGPAAVPGDAARSLLVTASRRQGGLAMPPKEPLRAEEVAVLERWVAAGMPWPGQQVARPTAPGDADADWFERAVRPILAERCFECHDSNEPKAGLDLSSRASLLAGGERGPVAVPGQPAASLLLKAVRHQDGLAMPRKRDRLAAADIAVLELWIAKGLPWPESGGVQIVDAPGKRFEISAEQRAFWAFQPVADPPPPAVQDAAWVRDPIDRFVLARLEAAGLRPAPPADKAALIRRASFDLIGLPPTPAEVDAFLADASPGAFAQVVDRLLASPRYGERWARHWLDLVRYADAIHYDPKYTHFPAYPHHYRDWVIAALNADLPYDRFIVHQLAGDLLPESEGGGLPARVATGVLAIGNWQENDTEREKVRADIVDDQIDLVGRAFMGLTLSCARCHDHKFDPISAADYYGLAGIFFSTRVIGPDNMRLRLALAADGAKEAKRIEGLATRQGLGRTAKPGAKPAQDHIGADRERPLPVAFHAEDGAVKGSLHPAIGDVRIHLRGDHRRQGELVPRRFPVVIAGDQQPPLPGDRSGRLELARWLASPRHPLTARVLVNRVWRHHLGEGIVRTPDNLGKLGERPTHPELLDHLARRFVADGWSLKKLHRAILLSATWRQSAVPRPEVLAKDPDNRLLGRVARRRLEAEAVRDALLAVGGRLELGAGGAPWSDREPPRRTIFLHVSRFDTSPFWTLFDGADPNAIVARRESSIVPQQALFLLNNPLVRACAEGLAAGAGSAGDDAAITRAYRLCFARAPSADELRLARAFLAAGAQRSQAWVRLCHALLCSNEFLFVD